MKDKEAIRILKEAVDSTQEEYDKAFDMAIQALEMQDKLKQFISENDNHKWIKCNDWSKDSIIKLLKRFVSKN